MALSVILILMTLWRRTPSFTKNVFVANTLLMCAGIVVTGYQLAGYMTEQTP